jgi:V/A-type H+/Na+-transporting ATPase subunit E
MESRLESLTQKIYQQGVERGRDDARALVEKARVEAAEIVAKARAEAEELVRSARDDAQAQKNRALAEIRLAGEQALSALRQEVVYLLSRSTLKADVDKVLDDPKSLLEVVKHAVQGTIARTGSPDIEVTFPADARSTLESISASHLKDLLNKGLDVRFDGRFERGFRIGPRNGDYQVSFTDADFLLFFQGYLKSRTRAILFPEA